MLIAADNTYSTIMEFFDKIVDKIRKGFIGPQSVIHPDYKV